MGISGDSPFKIFIYERSPILNGGSFVNNKYPPAMPVDIYSRGSACAAERKSVNPLLAGGCAACRLSLSVHKQTSPIDIDYFR